jgi:hypothetical protein
MLQVREHTSIPFIIFTFGLAFEFFKEFGGASLPHCMGPTLTYLMENEMPLVHHIVEQRGCSYIIEDDKGLNERTRGHPMLKPMSKLM